MENRTGKDEAERRIPAERIQLWKKLALLRVWGVAHIESNDGVNIGDGVGERKRVGVEEDKVALDVFFLYFHNIPSAGCY